MARIAGRCMAACDIGGTKVLIGLVDEAGLLLARERYLVEAPRTPAQVVGELTARLARSAARAGIAWEQVSGLGYSTPGPLDRGATGRHILSQPRALGECTPQSHAAGLTGRAGFVGDGCPGRDHG